LICTPFLRAEIQILAGKNQRRMDAYRSRLVAAIVRTLIVAASVRTTVDTRAFASWRARSLACRSTGICTIFVEEKRVRPCGGPSSKLCSGLAWPRWRPPLNRPKSSDSINVGKPARNKSTGERKAGRFGRGQEKSGMASAPLIPFQFASAQDQARDTHDGLTFSIIL